MGLSSGFLLELASGWAHQWERSLALSDLRSGPPWAIPLATQWGLQLGLPVARK